MKSIILHLEDLLRLKSGLKRQVRKPIKFRDPYVDNFQDNIAYACPAEALPGFPSDCWWFSSYAPRSSLTFSVDVPYSVGELLRVKETWAAQNLQPNESYFYKADFGPEILDKQLMWRPATCMPIDASRFVLEVTQIHAERLQEINDIGVYKEGYNSVVDFYKYWDQRTDIQRSSHMWSANPYVWVIDFNFYSGKELLLP